MLDTGRHKFSYSILGTQTIVRPALTTDGGLDIGMDQTLADGVEINFGGYEEEHQRNITAGTHDAFFRCLLQVEDASGVDIFFGLRKAEAVQTALATFTDIAGFQFTGDSSSAGAPINIVYNLNDATDISTVSTTQSVADVTEIEFEVRIKKDRYVQFFINNAAPTVDHTSLQMDNGDVLLPVIYLLNTTDVGGEVKLLIVEAGPLSCRRTGALSV